MTKLLSSDKSIVGEIDDKPIWCKKVLNDFYVLNGFYCVVDSKFDMTDIELLGQLVDLHDKFYPDGCTDCVFLFVDVGGTIGILQYDFDMCDGIPIDDGKVVLDEYRSWSRIRKTTEG